MFKEYGQVEQHFPYRIPIWFRAIFVLFPLACVLDSLGAFGGNSGLTI